MHIRKGLSTDLARLECCDFSFTVDEIAREPFLNGDLHIEALTDPYHKTYERWKIIALIPIQYFLSPKRMTVKSPVL